MGLSRRKFLQLVVGGTAYFGLSESWLKPLAHAVSQAPSNLPVVWLQGATCAGCSESLLNTHGPDVVQLVTKIISLQFHQTVMAGQGDLCVQLLDKIIANQKGKFILAVEGAVPTGANGEYCTIGRRNGKHITMLEWTKKLGEAALAVVSIGTCSSFGGIPAAEPNPTGAKPVSEVLPNAKIINLPGCPARPQHIVGTIAHVRLFGIPELDGKKRPKMYYKYLIHENCEKRAYFDKGEFAKDFGEDKCLYELGCKGPVTHNSCSVNQWNSGINWPIRAGAPCLGCSEDTWAGTKGNAVYAKLPLDKVPGIPGINVAADKLGKGLAVATAVGVAAHAAVRVINKQKGGE